MKIWLVTNNTVQGYDTYDSQVVAAETEEEARMIYPGEWYGQEPWDGSLRDRFSSWCAAKDATVEYLGHTDREMKTGCILASFNAG